MPFSRYLLHIINVPVLLFLILSRTFLMPLLTRAQGQARSSRILPLYSLRDKFSSLPQCLPNKIILSWAICLIAFHYTYPTIQFLFTTRWSKFQEIPTLLNQEPLVFSIFLINLMLHYGRSISPSLLRAKDVESYLPLLAQKSAPLIWATLPLSQSYNAS